MDNLTKFWEPSPSNFWNNFAIGGADESEKNSFQNYTLIALIASLASYVIYNALFLAAQLWEAFATLALGECDRKTALDGISADPPVHPCNTQNLYEFNSIYLNLFTLSGMLHFF